MIEGSIEIVGVPVLVEVQIWVCHRIATAHRFRSGRVCHRSVAVHGFRSGQVYCWLIVRVAAVGSPDLLVLLPWGSDLLMLLSCDRRSRSCRYYRGLAVGLLMSGYGRNTTRFVRPQSQSSWTMKKRHQICCTAGLYRKLWCHRNPHYIWSPVVVGGCWGRAVASRRVICARRSGWGRLRIWWWLE